MAAREVTLSESSGKYSMTVNRNKTQHAGTKPEVCTLEAILGSCKWKQGGEGKKQQSSAAFNQIHSLGIRGWPVSVQMKIKIYNGTVLPFFAQSTGGAAFKSEEDELEAFTATTCENYSGYTIQTASEATTSTKR